MALKYSEQAQNKIVVYYIMPDEDKYIIDSIIKNDEGGFVLTTIPGDNDGGFTYGGITKKVWQEYCPSVTIDDFKTGSSELAIAATIAVEIYSCEYFTPLKRQLWSMLCSPTAPLVFKMAIFSCAVNCGAQTAINIYNESLKDYSLQVNPRIKFLKEWAKHYVEIK